MDTVLRQGNKGNAVADLQQLLTRKGFYSGKIDGDFGAGTANAVLKFQKTNGLTTDGIVGSSSWAALRAGATSQPTATNALPTLLPGSKGAAVAQAQQLLKAKGYYQGRIDGDFGMGTRDAIASFQRANGLTVDGKVGEQTWKKLQAPAIAEVTPQPPVISIEIVRPPSPASTTPNATTPSPLTPTTTPSIFMPVSTTTPIPATQISVATTSPTTSNPSPSASAISLADAANSYSRAKLSNQTDALNNLQANISPEILQQFLQRWQTASGQNTSTLSDAFSSYNAIQMTSQNLALQWLQSQLLPQAIAQFRQDWSKLNTTISSGTPFTPSQPDAAQPNAFPSNTIQMINLTDAVKNYDRTRFPNQVIALEKLQEAVSPQTLQQFFQRWTIASQQNAIAISLVDVFQDYASYNFPDQVTALRWLEKELSTPQLEQFSRDWQA
jgi:peptidoglycan hydrolase-like protein with peptidoglycan-binding domain